MEKREFKLAQPYHIESIFAIYEAAIGDMRAHGVEQWDEIYPALHDISRDVSRQEMYVATVEGNILCAVTMNEEQDPGYIDGCWRFDGGPIAVIHRLCVHPKAQGTGLGKWTMRCAQERLIRCGYSSVRLDAFVNNRASNALYSSLGYRRAGEIQLRKGQFILYEKLLKG